MASYIQRGQVEVQALAHTLKPDRLQRGRHCACVIGQQ